MLSSLVRKPNPMDRTGHTARITGASSGIGAAFSDTLATRGADRVLAARREDRLSTLAHTLRARHGRKARVIAADLAVTGSAGLLLTEAQQRGLTVDFLVNNLGFGSHGDVADTDPGRLTAQIQLNVTDLTRAYLPSMLQRGQGAFVNVASAAADQPVPHLAVYAATKAYVLSFTEVLGARRLGPRRCGPWPRLRAPGISSSSTPPANPHGSDARRPPPPSRPRCAPSTGSGPANTVSGFDNAVTVVAVRFAPRRFAPLIAYRLTRGSK